MNIIQLKFLVCMVIGVIVWFPNLPVGILFGAIFGYLFVITQ